MMRRRTLVRVSLIQPLWLLRARYGASAFSVTKTTANGPCVSSHFLKRRPWRPEYRHSGFHDRVVGDKRVPSHSALPLSLRAACSALSSSSIVVVFAAALAALIAKNVKNRSGKIFWPNAQPDPNYPDAPLPPGSLGSCPFVGNGISFFWGSRDYGSGSFYIRRARKLEQAGDAAAVTPPAPRTWKYGFFGRGVAVFRGGDLVKRVLSTEFEGPTAGIASAVAEFTSPIMGMSTALNTETDRDRHSFLRRLVGQALTPSAVSKSISSLQVAAERQVERILWKASAEASPSFIKMDEVCNDYTLDIAWRQILGLELLSEEEQQRMMTAIKDWVGGTSSIRNWLNIFPRHTKGYRALQFLESRIEDRIDELESNGPNDSTLSGIVFAEDEESGGRKLTRRQVVDNAMLLIFAGSETSASTLTNAVLLLGLNKDCWKKLVAEQRRLQADFGEPSSLTKEMLDRESSPYLDAVVKESLRIRPLFSSMPRKARQTLVLDGIQVPENWIVDWSAVLTHYYDDKTFKEDGSHMVHGRRHEGIRPGTVVGRTHRADC